MTRLNDRRLAEGEAEGEGLEEAEDGAAQHHRLHHKHRLQHHRQLELSHKQILPLLCATCWQRAWRKTSSPGEVISRPRAKITC